MTRSTTTICSQRKLTLAVIAKQEAYSAKAFGESGSLFQNLEEVKIGASLEVPLRSKMSKDGEMKK